MVPPPPEPQLTNKKKKFARFKQGDAVELIWQDACTQNKWTDLDESARVTLTMILTRGTLVTVREDAVVVALDAGLTPDGRIGDHHGIGVVPIDSVVAIYKLRRSR